MTDAQGPFFQEGDTGKPTGYTAVTAFSYTNKTMFADIIRRLQNQHRESLWNKGLHADLLDGHHAADFQTQCDLLDSICDIEDAGTAGLLTHTGSGVAAARTLTVAPASLAALTIADGSGAAGNPTFTVDPTLIALAGLNSTAGVVVETAADTFAKRSISPDPNKGIGVTNPTGAAGDIGLAIDCANIASATIAAADSVFIKDADDSTVKLAAVSGIAAAINAVTEASAAAAADRVLTSAGADRTAQGTSLKFSSSILEDTAANTLTMRAAAGQGTAIGRAANTSAILGTTVNIGDLLAASAVQLSVVAGSTLAGPPQTTTLAGGGLMESLEDDGTNGDRRYIKEVQTTDATVTAMIDIPRPSASATCLLEYRVTAVNTADTTKRVVQREVVEFYDNAGTLTLGTSIEGPNTANSLAAGGTIAVSASGTNIRVTVRGAAATTINWGIAARISWRNTTT